MPYVISHLTYKRSWCWNLLKNSGCMAISTCTGSSQILRWGKKWRVHAQLDVLPVFRQERYGFHWLLMCVFCKAAFFILQLSSYFLSSWEPHGLAGKQTAPFWLGAGRAAAVLLLGSSAPLNTGKGLNKIMCLVMPLEMALHWDAMCSTPKQILEFPGTSHCSKIWLQPGQEACIRLEMMLVVMNQEVRSVEWMTLGSAVSDWLFVSLREDFLGLKEKQHIFSMLGTCIWPCLVIGSACWSRSITSLQI